MKTTIVPAQITTVEDKIAGNLNMVQIALFLTATFAATVIFVLFPKSYHLNPLKTGLILSSVSLCLILALRIKEIIVIDWLAILTRYAFRPRFYVFDKKDQSSRIVDYPKVNGNNFGFEKYLARAKSDNKTKEKVTGTSKATLTAAEALLWQGKYDLNFKSSKGGLDVAVTKV